MDSDDLPKTDGEESLKTDLQPTLGLRRSTNLLNGPTLQRTRTDLLLERVNTESKKYVKNRNVQRRNARNKSGLGDETVASDSVEADVLNRPEETLVEDQGIPSDVTDSSSEGGDADSSGAEFDTDLELEQREATPDDRWGRKIYRRNCRRMGLIPVTCIDRDLRTPYISVQGRGLNEKDALALACALIDNYTVTSLTLPENCLGVKGTEYIAMMLSENDVIKHVNISSNNIGSLGTRAVLEMMLDNTTITKLELAGNGLTDNDAFMFAEYLEETATLKQLNLSYNNFGEEAGKILGPAIGINESLQSLDLSWNKIRGPGGTAVCRGVQANTSIQSLNLAYNGLSTVGALAMAEALLINDQLRDLDLTCNRIFDDGATLLGKALETNETLMFLRISNNPMTTMSAVRLLSVIKKNEYSALELVDMSSSHIYKHGLKEIEEIRTARPNFRFKYAGVIHSDDAFGEDEKAFSDKNPLTILKEYIASKNLRLVDLFKQLDKDGGGSISRVEFVEGLKSIEVPLTAAQLDRLIDMLDKDGDGEVDYAELVAGDREHRRKMMMRKQIAVVRLAQAAKKKTEPRAKVLVKHQS